MAKKSKDPFETFKQATLGSNSALSSALSSRVREQEQSEPKVEDSPAPAPKPEPVVEPDPAPKAVEAPEKISKNANRELVSFHISKETKKKLNLLKVEAEKSLNDLYTEAIDDLLIKYSKKA